MDNNVALNGGGQFRNGGQAVAGKKMRKRRELDALVSHPAVSTAGKRLNRGRHTDEVYLAESTDDEDFYWSSSGREKNSGVSVGARNGSYLKRGGVKGSRARSWRTGFLRACSFVFVFACVVATCSVLYLFLDIRQQCSYLRHELDEVVAGSQGVPDALQKCHSLSKQLEHNQTDLANKFNSLSVQIKNFSIQISELHETISRVQASLAASPQVLDVPARLSELSNNVASFGSTLNDLTNTVNKLKEAATTRDKENGALRSNVTTLKESIETLQRKQSAPATTNDQNTKLEAKLVELATNLTKVNDTLSARLHFLHDDQVKNHVHLEDVENVNSNLSSRVTSLFQDVTALSSSLSDVTKHVTSLESNLSSPRDSVPAASDVTGGLLKKGDTISGVSSDMSSQKAGDIASIFKDEAPDHLRGDGGDTSKISMPTSAGPLELDLNLLPSGTPTSDLEVASNPAAETPASSRSPRVTRNIIIEARIMNSAARK